MRGNKVLPTSPESGEGSNNKPKGPKGVDTLLRTKKLQNAKAGDIVLFRASSKGAAITKAVTRSEFSHAGILAPFADADGPLVLYEACRATYGTPDLYWGDKSEHEGVHVFDTETRLGNYHGDAWLLPLSRSLSREETEEVTKYCMKHVVAKTTFDYKQMVGAGIDIMDEDADGQQMFEAEEDETELFCTEFISFALKEVGIFQGNASEVTPADVIHFPFVEDAILVKNNVLGSLMSIGVDRRVADPVLEAEMLKSPEFPIISRDSHKSRYLYNQLPEGNLQGCNTNSGYDQNKYIDKSGATWQRSPCCWENPLMLPFAFTLRLRDSSTKRLLESGSSAIVVSRRDAENGNIADGLYQPGTYWFSDPRDAGYLSHCLQDVFPNCCYWLLCCTMMSSKYNEQLEGKLKTSQDEKTGISDT